MTFAEKRDGRCAQPSIIVIPDPAMSCGDLLFESSDFLRDNLEPRGPRRHGLLGRLRDRHYESSTERQRSFIARRKIRETEVFRKALGILLPWEGAAAGSGIIRHPYLQPPGSRIRAGHR